MAIIPARYVNEKGSAALRAYEYNGRNDSIMYKHVFRPIAIAVVDRILPVWMAPNVVTLLGLCCSLVNLALVSLYAPTLTEDMPSSVYFLCGLNLFLYQTLDNADGQQARKTRSSSALGQLFDHGCDAVNTTMSCLVVAAVLRIGVQWTLPMLLTAQLTFYYATYAEYVTGEFVLGAISGPDEGLFLCYCMCFATALFGSGIWFASVKLSSTILITIITVLAGDLGSEHLLHANQMVVLAAMVASVPVCTADMRRALAHVGKEAHAGVMRGIVPMYLVLALTVLWVKLGTRDVLEPLNDLAPSLYYMLYLAQGFVFARIVCWLILCHFCKGEFRLADLRPLLLLLFFPTLNQLTPLLCLSLAPSPSTQCTTIHSLSLAPSSVAFLLLLASFALFAHYALKTITQIALILHIRPFSLAPSPSPAPADTSAPATLPAPSDALASALPTPKMMEEP